MNTRIKKAYITIGISASGKSTWAGEKVLEDAKVGTKTIEINRDEIRFSVILPGGNWSTYKFTSKNEARVTEITTELLDKAIKDGVDIIISDTNLNSKYRNPLVKKLTDAGYEVELKEFPITFEKANLRDRDRLRGVGYATLYTQYLTYVASTQRMYQPNPTLPTAIIVDIDGTVANKGNRSPFDWMKVHLDTPRELVITMILAVAEKYNAQILFTSGRDEVCRDLTVQWITKHIGIENPLLFMRPHKSMEKDTIVKERILWTNLTPNYNIVAAFDDRPCIVRLWNSLQIPHVIAVADPYLEF